MRKKRFGIFGKAFLYTAVLLMFILGATIAIFASQFGSAYEAGRKQQLVEALKPFFAQLEGKLDSEVVKTAKEFHEKNVSLVFLIQDENGQIIYTTGSNAIGFDKNKVKTLPEGGKGDVVFNNMSYIYKLENGSTIHSFYSSADSSFFTGVINNSGWLLILIFLVSVAGAFICARGMSKPIKSLASNAVKMSKLEQVDPPRPRSDEIGQLSETIFDMYEELKETISQLEDEIAVKQKMEESQKDFFSAASHELKTPVAAMAALIEEMLEGFAQPEEYPHHLRECMKMIAAQKKLISEILEVVKLNDSAVENRPENISLLEIAEKVTEKHKALLVSKGLNIKIDIPTSSYCIVDSRLIDRVLSNVVMNAIQNTQNGECVKIWSENGERQIRLCVLNTGSHIEESQLTQLFNPFYRLDKARSRKDGHSGLGLTIVKKSLDTAKVPFSLENTDDGVLFKIELQKS